MVAVNEIKTVFVYETKGVDEVRAKADTLAKSQGSVAKSSDTAAISNERVERRVRSLAEASALLAAANDQAARSQQLGVAAAGRYQQALASLAEAEARASRAAVSAANDNVASMERQASAYRTAGKFIAEHPVLTLAASVAAARALAGLATAAAGSLGAASASTAAFATGATGMGAAVVAGATLASRGLGAASVAATASAAGLGRYAEAVAGMTTATGLLSRGLSILPGILGPIGAAFVVFEVASSVIGKANADLDRMIALGEKAQKIDVGAAFLRSFESLGPKLRATVDQMDAALQKAASFVADKHNAPNGLLKSLNDLTAQGFTGPNQLRATTQADLAATTEERIKAALAAMVELDALGQHLAAIDLGNKVFGPDVIDRLRTGQMTIAQFAADLEAASAKEVLKQEQVDRALALNRNIEDTKRAISEAWAVTFDWSSAALVLQEIWLKILQAVRWIVESMNDGIAAVGAFGSAITSAIGGAIGSVAGQVNDLLAKMGIVAKQQAAAEAYGPQEAQGPKQPPITARQFSEVFGPNLPSPKAAASAKQASQAAQAAASSYDLLIQKTKDHIAELDLEAQYVGKDADAVVKLKLAHQLARAAQKDGTVVTEAMRAEWDKLGDSLAASKKGLDDSRRAFELMKEGQRELASDFTTFADDLVLGGKRMDEAFQGLAKTLSSNALKAIISGEGPLAGLLGMASEGKGELGGLLGGKFNLGSLFDTDKIEKAVAGGTIKGVDGSIFGDLLTPQKTGGGFMSSKLGGGLVAAGAGAAIGYSSQSPLMGALGGGLAGLMSGNPIMGVVGAGAGLLGGLLGKSQAQKERERQIKEQARQDAETYKQAMPQINLLSRTLRGEGNGSVTERRDAAFQQMYQANVTASKGGDQATADRLVKEFEGFNERLRVGFMTSFEGINDEVGKGLGASGPFAQAAAAIEQLGESLKGFVADTKTILMDPGNTARAQSAARESALASLEAPKTLSAVETEFKRINGTASGLKRVLMDLGMSADEAATAIRERTAKAMDALRDKFNTDLDAKINGATGKGYLNEVADFLKEIDGLRIDQSLVGGDAGKLDAYFTAGAQKIVNDASLTGAAFDDLIQRFPDLQGRVKSFSEAMVEASEDVAAAAEALAQRQRAYQDRAFTAGNDPSTEAGALAAFDRSAAQERIEEAKLGGKAMADLEAALAAERLGIITDFGQRAADALKTRMTGYGDRLFAATNDTSDLGGQLMAFDRQAQREREEEIAAGGEALADLEATLYAERAKIVVDFSRQASEAERQRMAAAQTAFDTFARNIRQFVDGLRTNAASPLSPQARLAEAQSQYNAQLTAAKGGDRAALDGITTYASSLLEAAKGFYASSSRFQEIFGLVTSQLTALPNQVSAEQFIVNAIDASKVAVVSATQAMQNALVAGVQANSPALVAQALNGNFSRLDSSVNGLLDFGEFQSGIGPLATREEQAQARSIFNAIDANGDGQLSKMEVANASSGRVETYTFQTKNVLDVVSNATSATSGKLDQSNSIMNVQSGQMEQQRAILDAVNSWTNATAAQTAGTNQNVAAGNNVLNSIRALNDSAVQNNAQTNGHLIKILFNLQSANLKNGAIAHYAEGGLVTGAGTGRSDSISARLSNGEFIITAEATRRFGAAGLDAINDNSFRLPTVGMPMSAGATGVDGALLAEVRALRASNERLEQKIAELTDVSEAGHLGAISATRGVAAAVQDGNATASRQSLARPAKAA